jgi:hypothetical protein
MITYYPNHAKYMRGVGEINLRADSGLLSVTLTNSPAILSRASGSWITDGFRVGHRVMMTASSNVNTVYVIQGLTADDMTLMNEDGSAATLNLTGSPVTMAVRTSMLKALLMRSGFAFNRDDHATLSNLKATTGAITPSFFAATKKITRPSGSFLANGFVPGSKFWITNTASNPGPFTISTVSALEIRVNETVVDEVGNGDEVMTANDELATANGYTQSAKILDRLTLTEDDTCNYFNATPETAIVWTASGGSIGPTPGCCIVDWCSTDKTILQYIDFGGEQTATTGQPFTIASLYDRVL